MADTESELHTFAQQLGLRRSWYQPRSSPHYDLTQKRRAAALQAGAVELDDAQVVRLIRHLRKRKRLMNIFDTPQWKEQFSREFPTWSKDKFNLPPKEGSQDLSTLQLLLAINIEEGSQCPCCEQFVKVYKRKLYGSMAAWLIWLVKEHDRTQDWVDIRDAPVRGGDYAKLTYWKFCELKPNTDDSKRTSGLWKPTKLGAIFARGLTSFPAYAYVYNGTLYGFSEEQTTVQEALGDKFDFSELWG